LFTILSLLDLDPKFLSCCIHFNVQQIYCGFRVVVPLVVGRWSFPVACCLGCMLGMLLVARCPAALGFFSVRDT
jgi:hypothetical protein